MALMKVKQPEWWSLEKSHVDETAEVTWTDIFYGKYLQIDLQAIQELKEKLGLTQIVHIHTQPAPRVREYFATRGNKDVNTAEKGKSFSKSPKVESKVHFHENTWVLHIRLPMQQLAEQVEAQYRMKMDHPQFWTRYAQAVNDELIKQMHVGAKTIANAFVQDDPLATMQKWLLSGSRYLFAVYLVAMVIGDLVRGDSLLFDVCLTGWLFWFVSYTLVSCLCLTLTLGLHRKSDEEVKTMDPSFLTIKHAQLQMFAYGRRGFVLHNMLPVRYAKMYLAPVARWKIIELFWRPTIIRSVPTK